VSEPFDPDSFEPAGGPQTRDATGLPAPLADLQLRLQQLRPRQPQLDLALLERLAAGGGVSPPRAATGFSKMQLALAVAAAWLCGAIFGAALLLSTGFRTSDALTQGQLAASDARVPTAAAVETVPASDEMPDRGAVADTATPQTATAEAERQDAQRTKPGGPKRLLEINERFWESPLRVNSLRLQPSEQVFIRAPRQPNELSVASRSANGPGADATSATAASHSDSAGPINLLQPATPKSRQQLLDDLLNLPTSDLY